MSGTVMRLLQELRRRRVFRVAGLYVVGAWLALQAADVLFPGWGIPGAAIRYLFLAVLLGFPVALVFGWIFEVTPEGIRRTQPVGSEAELREVMPLKRADYLILAALLVVLGAIAYDTTGRVLETATTERDWRPSLAEIEPHSVAVLPFASLSADPEHEYFADGISEEIRNRLSAFSELKVIARTSSFAFKDSGYDIGRISGLLAVNYLLQGSVRRDGERLRISAQLVDRAGLQVWSENFDRQFGGVFVLQDEIAEAVASSIVPRIVSPSAGKRLPDLEAYEQFLIGREIMSRRTALWWQQAPEYFSRAIELDPQFAEPYAARAVGLVFGAQLIGDYEAELDRAQQDISMARALNPDLALAYAAQALLDERRKPEAHAEREALLRRALALDPSSVDTLNWLGGALSRQGRMDEAEEVLHQAARIDPLAPAISTNLALRDAEQGRLADAERRLLRLLEVPQPSLQTFATLAELYFESGRLVEAVETSKRGVLAAAALTGEPAGSGGLLWAYATLGMWEAFDGVQVVRRKAWPAIYHNRLHAFFFGEGRLDAAERLVGVDAVLADAAVEPGSLNPGLMGHYGITQALAGDHEGAIRTLGPLLATHTVYNSGEIAVRHAVAWALQHTGQPEQAAGMLADLDKAFVQRQQDGRLHRAFDIFDHARNSLLLGDVEGALDRLQQAEAAGWRDYYAIMRDPRWDPVRDEPRFRKVMERVKADIDRQRALVESADREEDFAARLGAMITARQAGEPVPSGTPPQNR